MFDAPQGALHQLGTLPAPLPLPLDPNTLVTGAIPHRATVFKSALSPLGLTFRTVRTAEYSLIFKSGDDLRASIDLYKLKLLPSNGTKIFTLLLGDGKIELQAESAAAAVDWCRHIEKLQRTLYE